jgi:hypothetical protein
MRHATIQRVTSLAGGESARCRAAAERLRGAASGAANMPSFCAFLSLSSLCFASYFLRIVHKRNCASQCSDVRSACHQADRQARRHLACQKLPAVIKCCALCSWGVKNSAPEMALKLMQGLEGQHLRRRQLEDDANVPSSSSSHDSEDASSSSSEDLDIEVLITYTAPWSARARWACWY